MGSSDHVHLTSAPVVHSGRGARVAAAVVVILATGGLGLLGAFSDLAPSQTLWLRVLALAAVYVMGAGLVGVLLPRHWYLAILTAWGPGLLGAVALAVMLMHGREQSGSALLLFLGVVPAVALASGYLGRWVVLRARR